MADDHELPESATTTNVWGFKNQRNPYLHNVFGLLDVDPDSGEESLLTRCKRLDGRIRAGQQVVRLGHAIEPSDTARARYLASNADEFVAERLLAHTVHEIDPAQLQGPIEAIERHPLERPQDLLPLPLRNLDRLTKLLPDLPSPDDDATTQVETNDLRSLAEPSPDEELEFDL